MRWRGSFNVLKTHNFKKKECLDASTLEDVPARLAQMILKNLQTRKRKKNHVEEESQRSTGEEEEAKMETFDDALLIDELDGEDFEEVTQDV